MELSESEDDELVELKRQYLRIKLQLLAKRKARKRREEQRRRKRKRGKEGNRLRMGRKGGNI